MKKIFLILFLSTFLFANSVIYDFIKNIIGEKEYRINNKLIMVLFENENRFIVNNLLNYKLILKTLKKNNLLKLDLHKKRVIKINFIQMLMLTFL